MALLPSLIFHSEETKNYWQLSDGDSQAFRKFLRKVSRQVPVELKIMKKIILSALLSGVVLSVTTSNLFSQTVEKVADLSYGIDLDGGGHGGYAPLERFTQVGTNLWFTTSLGGYWGLGTISRFDLTTHLVSEVAFLDSHVTNNTGSKPESPLLVIGDDAYFTAVSGGTNSRGAISKINLTSGVITPLFAFPNNGLPNGNTPRAGLTQIGDDLWTTTQSGGTSNRGVVLKYSLTSGAASLVTNLDGPQLGGQGASGLTRAGDAWYFTTSSGGNTFKTTNYLTLTLPGGGTVIFTNSMPLGAGTLDRLTFDGSGNPIVTRLLSVPGGYTQGLYEEPVLVGTNSLYFTSVGPNSLPGAIARYDVSTGFYTNLFSFSTNPIPAKAYGVRPGYSGLVEWLGELYFINRLGGTNADYTSSVNAWGGGTVVKFNIASNTVIKLADLGNTNLVDDLGSPGGFFGTGTIVQETNRFYIYYPLTSGGASDLGSIIRVLLPPPPIQASISVTNSATNILLSWSGGYPPYVVLTNGDFSIAATNWAAAITNLNADVNTTNWSVTLPVGTGSTFYRVRGQSQ